jgi:hypothetical protein
MAQVAFLARLIPVTGASNALFVAEPVSVNANGATVPGNTRFVAEPVWSPWRQRAAYQLGQNHHRKDEIRRRKMEYRVGENQKEI